MSVTVVGSIAFDAVKTPFGERERMLGGAATHFALAASFFDQVRVVGPVGGDFGDHELAVLSTRGTDVSDVERDRSGSTFFWAGEYGWDLNSRTTLDTQLNVFAEFAPKLSAPSRSSEVLFLANIQPELQRDVLEQCSPSFVALDSMDLWIETARDALVDVIGRIDCLILNDAELRQLTGQPNLVSAAREILGWGPSIVVAKQGEYGAALVTADAFFALPAYPLETVVDPTGAGDTFAGGFVGYLAGRLDRLGDSARAAPGDGLRHRAGVVQRRGVRHRARGTATGVGDRCARRRAGRDHTPGSDAGCYLASRADTSSGSVIGSNGLAISPAAPRSDRRSRSAVWVLAVRKITGVSAPITGRSSSSVPGPSTPGIITSSSTASSGPERAASTAASAEPASSTSQPPIRSRLILAMRRMSSSSSTISSRPRLMRPHPRSR